MSQALQNAEMNVTIFCYMPNSPGIIYLNSVNFVYVKATLSKCRNKDLTRAISCGSAELNKTVQYKDRSNIKT